MTEQLRVTVANYVSVDIATSPDTLWQFIVDEYVEAKKFRESGAAFEPIDDRAAYLGGYRIRIEQNGLVDERIIHITEQDDAVRRLSVLADYRTVPAEGMKVWAKYRAEEIAGGARYSIDCHADIPLEVPEGSTRAEVAAIVAEMNPQLDAAMLAYLDSVKARIEGAN